MDLCVKLGAKFKLEVLSIFLFILFSVFVVASYCHAGKAFLKSICRGKRHHGTEKGAVLFSID